MYVMALQIWLPLNGNLNNQGLAGNLTFTNVSSSNTTIDNNGKIGKCYKNNSFSAGGLISNTTINLGSKQSMFCWFKFDSLNSSSSLGGAMVGQHRYPSNTGMGLTIKYVSSTTGYLSINTGTGSSRTYNTYCNTTLLSAGNWYHGGFTYDGTTVKIYLNGVCENTTNLSGMSVPADYIMIFNWSFSGSSGNSLYGGYKLNGSLNDVRVYDHCLSSKEVHSISQGLVLHYSLDDIYNSTTLRNKYTGTYFLGSSSSSSFTKTALTGETGYNYKLSYLGTGSSTWPSISFPAFSFTADAMHQYSLYARCNVKENTNFYFRAARVNNDYHGCQSVNIAPSADGQWHRYELSQVIPATLTWSNNTYNCSPRIEILTDNLSVSGRQYTLDVDLKLIQVVESNEKVPVIDNVLTSTVVYDDSGYQNNGTVAGSINLSNDSPRYRHSSYFDGSTSINIGKQMYGITDAITITFWCKGTNIPRPLSCTEGGGFNFEYSGNSYNFALYTTANAYSANVLSGNVKDNNWHFIAGTFDGINKKIYTDGVLTNSIALSAKYEIKYNTSVNLYIGQESPSGNMAVGYISDVRIYATALSDSDIASLYNVGAVIDNGANMHTYEYHEIESTTPKVHRTGVTDSSAIIEPDTITNASFNKAGIIKSKNFYEI